MLSPTDGIYYLKKKQKRILKLIEISGISVLVAPR
jgi:hypothetical protein